MLVKKGNFLMAPSGTVFNSFTILKTYLKTNRQFGIDVYTLLYLNWITQQGPSV